MKRPDWSSRLFAVIEEHRSRSFAWGSDDCGLFASRCYDAMHGTDIEQQLLAEYADASAQRLVASQSMGELVSKHIGPPTDTRAVRGDIVTVDGGEGEALGVCLGSKVAALGANGLHYLSRSDITAVWRG
jgi:hypothetical protein